MRAALCTTLVLLWVAGCSDEPRPGGEAVGPGATVPGVSDASQGGDVADTSLPGMTGRPGSAATADAGGSVGAGPADANALDADGAGDSSGADAGSDASSGGGVWDGSNPHSPCVSGATYGSPLPTGDLTPTLVADTFQFLEGPVWFADQGVLFFSDMTGAEGPENVVAATIHRLTPPATIEVFVASSGSNGLAIAPDGRILAATQDERTLSYYDPVSGARETRQLRYMGKRLNSPNDIAVRGDGHVYFTDPDWQLGDRDAEVSMTGFYHLTPAGALSLVDPDPDHELDKPNGIALSPDGSRLYIGSYEDEVWYYPLDAAGEAGARQSFAAPGASDGMTVDCAGHVYVTAEDVVVYDGNGTEIGQIPVPGSPTNVAFGGNKARTLYITAGGALYAIELDVPGHPF